MQPTWLRSSAFTSMEAAINYYEHHIGDYDADTAHLSWVEDMAYTRLLRLYYRKEMPIPADVAQACRLIRAASKEERKAVDTVLNEFFVLRDDGWHQDRCDTEIAKYQARVEHNRAVGKKGGRPKKSETQTEPAENPPGYLREPEQNPPQTPDPIHHISPSLRSGESADKPLPTPGRKKSEAKTLATYLAECKAAGVKPVPDGHAARTWAEEAGIADEMLQIAWVQFRERYTEGEKGKGKRYKDWAGHFATAIKGNWFKLWFAGDEGAMCWTSNGLTHKAVLDARMARQRPTQEVSHAPA